MTRLVQLYQRLSARAMSCLLTADRSSVTHTVRTEITVEHQSRVWLLEENLRGTTARPEEPSSEPAEPARRGAIDALLPSPSTKPHLEGESR